MRQQIYESAAGDTLKDGGVPFELVRLHGDMAQRRHKCPPMTPEDLSRAV